MHPGLLLVIAIFVAPALGQAPTRRLPAGPATPAEPAVVQDPGAAGAEVGPKPMRAIRAERLLQHAKFLTSDELGGRLTGMPGQALAADYIAAQFASCGLEPLGDVVDGKPTFLQHYPISRTSLAATSQLAVGDLRFDDGFAVLGAAPIDERIGGELRFVGFGSTSGGTPDVADGDLGDRIAVVALRRPRGRTPAKLDSERKFMMSMQALSQVGRTAKGLAASGAKAILFVELDDPVGLQDALNYLALSPGKDLVAPRFPGADAMLSQMAPKGGGPPVLVLSLAASERLLGALDITPAAFRAYVGGEGERPAGRADVAGTLALKVEHHDDATATNVVAVLRGGDPQLAGEALVYSAHMDHVGRRLDGAIFHGADDNASGTSGLLEIAAAWAHSPEKPRRSIVFLSVSGEEMGLWGSKFFAQNPTWPIGNVVADINTDMIGRSGAESGPLEVTVTPSHDCAKFSTIVQDAAGFAEALGLSLTSGDKYYTRSDHFNFAKKGIPVVFFCNGEHEDYHQVTDTFDKLDGAKMERLARLAFWTGWSVANADERPRRLGARADWR